MTWNISFITEENFKKHVSNTVHTYVQSLKPIDLKKFNSNCVDPIKLLFDKTVYNQSWQETVFKEIARQRDKSNNNDIGYFHQNIFKYIHNCNVPKSGWDVIYTNPSGILMPDGSTIKTIYAQLKNKHNTMNSGNAQKEYIYMQQQLLHDDDCACFLVEAISKRSQNTVWSPIANGRKTKHKLIRRVSIDKFYEIVTGESNAFYQVCMVLPNVIKLVLQSQREHLIPKDTAFDELQNKARQIKGLSGEAALTLAVYRLAFETYLGFTS